MPQSFAEQLRSIPMSPNLGQSLERAHRFARDQSHRLVTLEHLLLALTEDAEAALILQSANVDLARLGTDVSGYLGRLMEDMRAEPGIEPRPDAELLRVLQAAASAAQQSRRKQIDGAIVLAAIVGDGKSPAAGLLKAHGMTFEEAIRALQRANTKARLKPLAKAASAAPAVEAPAAPAPAPPQCRPMRALRLPGPSRPLRATSPSPSRQSLLPQPLATQSADEILAAARARIQQRAAATARTQSAMPHERRRHRSEKPTAPAALAVDSDPAIEPVDPVQTKSLTAAIEAAMASSPPRKAEPRLPPTVPSVTAETPEPPSRRRRPPLRLTSRLRRAAAWTPPPEPRPQPPARLPPAAPARRHRRFRPGRCSPTRAPAARRCRLRARQPTRQPQPGLPNRPARAPWPEPGERGAGRAAPARQRQLWRVSASASASHQAPERPGLREAARRRAGACRARRGC